MDSYGLLIDFTACIGCKACAKACKEANKLPGEPGEELSYADYTVVKSHGKLFYRQLCMHCLTPTCVSVCPVAALQKSPQGPVTYDGSKCIGCRYCMLACPFSIPRYEWHDPTPVVRKCIMCVHRIAEGKEPACAWACPMGATRFGNRDRLLDIARGRIARSALFCCPFERRRGCLNPACRIIERITSWGQFPKGSFRTGLLVF